MPRSLDSPQLLGLQSNVVPALFFVRLMFPSTPIYVHNGIWNLSFGGNTYIGVYDFAVLDVLEESIENRPADVIVGLRRVPKVIIDPVINEKFHGEPAHIYYSVASPLGIPVSTPVEIWRGTMDYLELKTNEDGVQYLMTCKNIMHNWNKSRVRRITDAEQQRRWPGDTAYKHLASLEEKSVPWGPLPERTRPGGGSRPGNGSTIGQPIFYGDFYRR
jgi:hypothetical protein